METILSIKNITVVGKSGSGIIKIYNKIINSMDESTLAKSISVLKAKR
ncbi:MAG: hypothetical protein L3J08_09345 [Flavobacteriaceae bacterium]|nr:hypothetical protein [Flavobacteriaceae bacterium]